MEFSSTNRYVTSLLGKFSSRNWSEFGAGQRPKGVAGRRAMEAAAAAGTRGD